MLQYRVQDLGTRAPDGTYATGINNLGQVSGYSYSGTSALPLKWSAGTIIEILTSAVNNNLAADALYGGINASGKVIGYEKENDSIYTHGFFLNQDYHEPIDIGDHNGDQFPTGQRGTIAYGLNNASLIVGEQGSSVKSGFLYDFHEPDDKMKLKNLDRIVKVHGWRITSGRGINDDGWICGTAQLDSGVMTGFLFNQATPTVITDLHLLNAKSVIPLAINAKAFVVGYAELPPKYVPFFCPPLKTGGQAKAVQLMPFNKVNNFERALSINSHNVIVGSSQSGSTAEGVAVIWKPDAAGKYTTPPDDLNNMIDTGAGWKLSSATGINDQGYICGNGTIKGNKRAFLLTPI